MTMIYVKDIRKQSKSLVKKLLFGTALMLGIL